MIPATTLDFVENPPLLERSDSNATVQLYHWDDITAIRVRDTEGDFVAVVPASRARDAFEHPYVYL